MYKEINKAIKYCVNDCILLLKVIINFNEYIFEKFSVDANKSPTLSSLAFKIFRKKFFKDAENLIPAYRFKEDANIRKAFTGGTVDLIKPTNLDLNTKKVKEKIWLFDFNSLFPSVLRNFDFPCGKVRHFVGNILFLEENPIGFFKANIVAPTNLKVPILQVKTLVNGKLTTISPVGAFTGWFFSEELYNARDNFGYKFEIIEGYAYSKRVKLFAKYIDTLYEMRLLFNKLDIRNYISKILLNSFYGRWAMNPFFDNNKLLTEKEYQKLMTKGDITNLGEVLNFNNGYYLVIFNTDTEELEKLNSGNNANVSIGIAAATTAYSRIVMSQFKNNPKLDLYYFDTDSIVVDKSPEELVELFPDIIGPGLGQLKLEQEIEKAVFLSPKCYLLENTNGEKIIKIKGFNFNNTNKDFDLQLIDFVELLKKDSNKQITQNIWVRDKAFALISIMEQAYSLAHNDNKRIVIYDINNNFVDTKPIVLNNPPQIIENKE